jgi:predicted dehydrogenase
VPALHALPEYELKAVCTAHEDTALASQKAFGTDLAFHNFDEMLACPEIDLVTVVTRVPTHYDLVMRALRAGKAVYCEWPLGAPLEQAEEMADLAAERSLYTAAGLQAHSDPTLMYARELIQKGYIGEVLAVDFAYIGKATTKARQRPHLAERPQGRRQYPDHRRRPRHRRPELRAGRFHRGVCAPRHHRHRVAEHRYGRDRSGRLARLGERVRTPAEQGRSLVSGGGRSRASRRPPHV